MYELNFTSNADVANATDQSFLNLPYLLVRTSEYITYVIDETGAMSKDDLAVMAEGLFIERHADFVIVPQRFDLTRNTRLGVPVEKSNVADEATVCQECGYRQLERFGTCPQCGESDMIEFATKTWVQRERPELA